MDTRTRSLLLAGGAAAIAAHRLIVSLGRHWGASASEFTGPLPGDDLVTEPDTQTTMAITIDASPEQVWPWLVQMGIDRGGFYSLLPVENGLLHLNAKNANRIVPEWQDLKVGDIMAFTPDGYPGGRHGPEVISIDPNRALVLNLGGPRENPVGSWQFVLEPEDDGGTRLLMRSRASSHRSPGLKLLDAVIEPGYLIMDVAMLRGIKERAERHQAA
jgi:uncharacterized protein YndB with AHSA1/START domain